MIAHQTLAKLFYKKTHKHPHKRSIGFFDENGLDFLNNAEYKDIVRRLFFGLHSLSQNAQEKVAILGQTSKEWHFFDMAILCHRDVVVPVYPTYLPHEVEYILNHSEALILIVENEAQLKKIIDVQDNLPLLKYIIGLKDIPAETIAQLNEKYIFRTYSQILETGAFASRERPTIFEAFIEESSPLDSASIIYTSGTTGEPKGALISQKAFCTMLQNVHLSLKASITSSDRNLVFLPLSHVLGRCDSLLNLIFDLETVYAESIDKVIDNLKLATPTILVAVPRIFEKVYAKILDKIAKESSLKKHIFDWALSISNQYYEAISLDRAPSPSLILQKNLAYKLVFEKIYKQFGGKIRFFVSGGAPISPEIIKFLQNANLTILEGYGLTETIAPCTLNPPVRQVPGTIGIPLGDVQLKFADDGEIMIKTEALFSTYYKNESATKEAFLDGWFLTGDIGELTPEGYVKITDRKKDIIITSAGKNVAPQKIENILKLQKHISNAMIIGDKRKFLTALISIDVESFKDEIHEQGLSQFPSYEEMAGLSSVYKIIEQEIAAINHELASFESIKGFMIAPTDFTVENGHITPSLKLKKKVVLKCYAKEIDELYQKLEG